MTTVHNPVWYLVFIIRILGESWTVILSSRATIESYQKIYRISIGFRCFLLECRKNLDLFNHNLVWILINSKECWPNLLTQWTVGNVRVLDKMGSWEAGLILWWKNIDYLPTIWRSPKSGLLASAISRFLAPPYQVPNPPEEIFFWLCSTFRKSAKFGWKICSTTKSFRSLKMCKKV